MMSHPSCSTVSSQVSESSTAVSAEHQQRDGLPTSDHFMEPPSARYFQPGSPTHPLAAQEVLAAMKPMYADSSQHRGTADWTPSHNHRSSTAAPAQHCSTAPPEHTPEDIEGGAHQRPTDSAAAEERDASGWSPEGAEAFESQVTGLPLLQVLRRNRFCVCVCVYPP